MTDEDLMAAWLQACDDLAAQRERTKDLHRQVQERELGPYSPDASVCHVEPEDMTAIPTSKAVELGLIERPTEGE